MSDVNAFQNLHKTDTSPRQTLWSVPKGVRLKRFYCTHFSLLCSCSSSAQILSTLIFIYKYQENSENKKIAATWHEQNCKNKKILVSTGGTHWKFKVENVNEELRIIYGVEARLINVYFPIWLNTSNLVLLETKDFLSR